MKSVEESRLELFETWFKVCQQARLNRGFDEYTNWEVTLMTMAFNAALNLVEIELPEKRIIVDGEDLYEAARNGTINQCQAAIHSLNLGLKIK